MRIGAIATTVNRRRREKGGGAKKRTPSEEELELLKKREHTAIQNIDIRENTREKLVFKKFPWALWGLAGGFLAGALFLLAYSYLSGFSKGG